MPHERPADFGHLLQRLRAAAGLSQQELAERAGLSERGISDLERGKRLSPHPATVRRLAGALTLADAERKELLRASHMPTASSSMAGDALAVTHTAHLRLPRQLTSFIGREQEMAQIRRELGTAHVLTLVGPGGVGKTRLALQLADKLREQDHQPLALVELAEMANPELVAQAVATTLGIPAQSSRPITAVLIDALRARRLLLILDNCEHLIDACAELAEQLLRACAAMSILATSREPLGIQGERIWQVPSLCLPTTTDEVSFEQTARAEAVQLFVQRAASAVSGFTLTEQNAPAVARICVALDGMPLALELAAARLTALSVEQLASRLSDALRVLTTGSRTAPARQQTLRATLDWSYGLLTDKERTVLQRLTVFAGGWNLEAAEAVCIGAPIQETDVLDLLSSLTTRSLVQVQYRGHQPRHHLLETVRQYAMDKLVSSGGIDAARDRHRDWYLALAEQAEPHLTSGEQAVWLDVLELESDNLRAALGWCWSTRSIDLGLRLAAALSWFWYVREDRAIERRDWLERFLAPTAGPASPGPQAKALAALLLTQAQFGQFQHAEATWETFRTLCEQTGERASLVRHHWLIGRVALWQGDLTRAQALCVEGTTLARDAGDTWALGQEVQGLGWTALNTGDNVEARRLCEQSLGHFRACQDWRAMAFALLLLGRAARSEEDYAAAQDYLEESLAINRRLRSSGYTASALYDMGLVARNRGDYSSAERLLEQALAIGRASAFVWWPCVVGAARGWIAYETGDLVHARALTYALIGFVERNPLDTFFFVPALCASGV